MKLTLLFTSLFIALSAAAQHQNRLIMQANNQYRQKQYDQAARSYDEILAFDSTSKIVRFNRANAGFRLGQFDDAAKSFSGLARDYEKPQDRSRACYNLGVCYSMQKKLEESIEAYKNALRFDPSNNQARENLQKALLELKRRTPPPPKKEDKKQNKKQQEQKMNPKEAEQDLKLLEQKEKELQQRMQKQKSRAAGGGGKKDW